MQKSTVVIIVAIVAVLGVGGVVIANNMSKDKDNDTSTTTPSTATEEEATSSNGGSESTDTETSEVNIQNFAFAPNKVTVKKGTQVTWTNKDSVKHDITPDSNSDAFQGSGKLLGQGESYSFTFNTVGTYAYHCSPHPYMKGTIEVTE